MKQAKWKSYAFWIVLSLVVGTLSGFLSRSGIELYGQTVTQPTLSPPAVLFPVVWSVLYIFMGISAARIYLSELSELRSKGLNLFLIQLAVNFFWSLIFFNLQSFALAFLWLLLLWGLVVWMILTFRQIDPPAALLQLPYLVWLTFAAYLSAGVWYLNG